MKVLIAIDNSVHSELAVEEFLRLGFAFETEVKIVSVIEVPIPYPVDVYGGDTSYLLEVERIERQRAQETLENAVQKIRTSENGAKLTISYEVLTGTPEVQVVEIAENWGANLLIVGSHGYNTWERLLLGSVSDAIVHHAPCSVLVVRAKK